MPTGPDGVLQAIRNTLIGQEVTAQEAASRVRVRDTLGFPLGPGQPASVFRALGERHDWEDLCVHGAYLTVNTELFAHARVHYRSTFFGPMERSLYEAGANIDYVPADFRRWAPLLEHDAPRVMMTAASLPDAEGFCSLSLHAGASVGELHKAGADPERLLIVEVSSGYPRVRGSAEHRHALHIDEIDLLVRSCAEPAELSTSVPTDVGARIAVRAATFVPNGATLQIGIGVIPAAIVRRLASMPGGGYGVHSEMFTDGLMHLHLAGKVTNLGKGQHAGVSVATWAMGSKELYRWLDDNPEVAFLPVELINAPHLIGRNARMVTVNGALAVDLSGQVVADTKDGNQFSGTGGHEDFVSAPGYSGSQRSLICLPSTVMVGGQKRSRIVPSFEAGAIVTTPRHQVDVVVTEFGVAQVAGRSVHERARALAEIGHPDFRAELLDEVARLSRRRLTR